MPRTLLALPLVGATLLALAPSGCGQQFDPASLLTGPRVLALIADPLAVGPADAVTIRPVRYLAGLAPQAQGWSLCPFTLGPVAGYRCAVPACELALDAASDGSLTAVPGALVAQCAASLAASGDLPAGVPAELPDSLEVLFTYWLRTSGGEEQRAVLGLPLWPAGAPAAINTHPLLAGVTIAGQEAIAGASLAPLSLAAAASDETGLPAVPVVVATVADSLEAYSDASGQARVEEALVNVYASAGAFDFDRLAGSTVTARWELADVAPGTLAELWVVVRDGRGGQAAGGPYRVPIVP